MTQASDIEVSSETIQMIDKVGILVGRTREQVLAEAVTLLGWAAQQTALGMTVALLDEDAKKYKLLKSPTIDTMAKKRLNS